MQRFASHRQTPLPLHGFLRPARQARDGFTLVELLVVIGILLLLATIAVGAYRGVSSADRVSGAARNFKTSLEGARSRAIADGQPRGLRLVLDPNIPHVVTSVVPIGAADYHEGIFSEVNTDDGINGAYTGNAYTGNEWRCMDATGVIARMQQRNLIAAGSRVEIPAFSGCWYPVVALLSPSEIQIRGELFLSDQDGTVGDPISAYAVPYRLQLAPPILPGAEPVVFPRGVGIDLNGSSVPPNWRATPSGPPNFSPNMDIMFAANGALTGSLTSAGLIHLYFADVEDIERSSVFREAEWTDLPVRTDDTPLFLVPAAPQSADQLVTLFTQTGMSVVADVDHTDVLLTDGSAGNDGIADTPTVFQYATAGREAK